MILVSNNIEVRSTNLGKIFISIELLADLIEKHLPAWTELDDLLYMREEGRVMIKLTKPMLDQPRYHLNMLAKMINDTLKPLGLRATIEWVISEKQVHMPPSKAIIIGATFGVLVAVFFFIFGIWKTILVIFLGAIGASIGWLLSQPSFSLKSKIKDIKSAVRKYLPF